ncbi:MAG: hypothetical protein H5T95_13650 [Firmicutes bacterium]|nr:hypothetical protein [Bacillota bacterium]
MQLAHTLTAVARRNITMMKRYLFNTVSALISIYMVFCLAFFGMKAFAATSSSRALDGTFEGTIVGFFVWTLAIFGYSGLSWELINEAQTGLPGTTSPPVSAASGWSTDGRRQWQVGIGR